MKKILSVTILFLTFFNCYERNSSDLNILSEKIKELDIKDSVKYVVILPEVWCQGCIQEGEKFMVEHVKNDDYLFILTQIVSLKILEQKTGITLSEEENVFIDRKLSFALNSNESIYPVILKMNGSKAISLEYQSPQNDAFSKLALNELE